MSTITKKETDKYGAMWSSGRYHGHSPGASWVPLFRSIARPTYGSALLDVGAGAGEASVELKKLDLCVTGFDLTDAGWNHKDIELVTGTIWTDLPYGPYDFGYCCDVMEHIPPEYTALCVSKILDVCDHTFFSISFLPDVMGAVVGEPLHLTIKPFTWWRDMLREIGTVYEARDMIGEGVFYVGR